MTRRLIRQALVREAGFTLAELLIAIALLTIGILGVGAALTMQAGGVSGGAGVGLAAVTRANYVSTATLLAQARIEQLKNTAYAGIASLTEDYGAATLAGYPNYKRVTTVTTDSFTVGATPYTVKRVAVQVFFRPPTESGLAPEAGVKLVTFISQHPS